MRWIGLILAVLALASNFPPSETIHIAEFPPSPHFGKPILLFLDDNRFPATCSWFRGRDQSENSLILRAHFNAIKGVHRINRTGAAYTGREDLLRRCSLIIRKLRASDAGPYTVSVMGMEGNGPVTGVRNLHVSYPPFSFHPEATRMVQFPSDPRVGQSVYLYLDNIQNPSECSWFRGKNQSEEGRIFTARYDGISKSYAIDLKGEAHRGREEVWRACSLVIRKVQASDSGTYTVSMGDERDTRPITAGRELRVSS